MRNYFKPIHFFRSSLISKMNSGPYAIGTDGSNDDGLLKMNPLLVRVFDNEKGKIYSQILDMGACKEGKIHIFAISTSDAICKIIYILI